MSWKFYGTHSRWAVNRPHCALHAQLKGAVRPKTVARSASTSGTKGRLFQGTRTACCAGEESRPVEPQRQSGELGQGAHTIPARLRAQNRVGKDQDATAERREPPRLLNQRLVIVGGVASGAACHLRKEGVTSKNGENGRTNPLQCRVVLK